MTSTHGIRQLIGLGVFLVVCAIGWLASAEEKSEPGLPRGWNLAEIEKEMPPYGVEGKVYVLAWKIAEDERPLRVETCLVLKVLSENSEEGRWCLAHLYRHPLSKEPKWELSMTHVFGEPGPSFLIGRNIHHLKRFKEPPSNKAIYAALGFEQVNWKIELDPDWKLIGCSVCEEAWQVAIGEKPTKK